MLIVLLVWQVSDAIHGDDKSDHAESLSLQKALYITCFTAAIGSACFLATTFYIHYDEYQVQLYIQHHDNKQEDGEKEPLLHSYPDSQQSSTDINYSVNNDQSVEF